MPHEIYSFGIQKPHESRGTAGDVTGNRSNPSVAFETCDSGNPPVCIMGANS